METNQNQNQREDFSVLVLASDLGIDGRSLLSQSERRAREEEEEWHECVEEDFSDLEALQAFRLQGSDRSGSRILRIVGKYFPATIISGERLKRYVFHKLRTELPEGPFCILYMHSTVHSEDNNPGMSILRWVYEELPSDYKERLQVVYFLHPGLRSRLAIATLGRLFLSGSVYWKIKYVSRLQYLWDDIKKGQVEIPEFVQEHDVVLEHRPLTDYGIEPDPLRLTGVPSVDYTFGRYEDKWSAGTREYM
ncbi:ganglioside-induced differentiation-associated protein 2-like [Iris pallida]|uniref:Ganglioside-induced differentiation-associated protein 2-like n=1 Tax=Iris pallida TaxID=29817 RepID=A0AAX6HCG7_IRIPA|nr:ganglioside-induced differentiation-associated protein 2-like [Iris pallida]KAJ6838452.1 ganglioside-induced differentiation-associated protein 2-like [Iris pallida]